MKKHLNFVILLFQLVTGCYKESDYNTSKAGSYSASITFYVDPPSIFADSFSVSRIIVEMPYDADSSNAGIQLSTDLGVFVNNNSQQITITATQNSDSLKRIGIVMLKSGTTVGMAHIQCTLVSLTRTLTDSFYNAFPTSIQLTASTLSVKPSNDSDGEVSFLCQLIKQQGFPSQRNVVSMKVVDTLGNPIGQFRAYNNLSDGNGQTQFVFVLGDNVTNGVTYSGKLFAIATVSAGGSLPPIIDTLNIYSEP